MIFGGDRIPQDQVGAADEQNATMTVQGMQDPNALLFSLFRLTLVDDYDYDVSSPQMSIAQGIPARVDLGLCLFRAPPPIDCATVCSFSVHLNVQAF